MTGTLYLIPTPLADDTADAVLPPLTRTTLGRLEHFLCENTRTARRFVSSLRLHPSVESLQFFVLNKETTADQLPQLMAPLLEGKDMGLLSEAGCPAIADPGALAVAYAHQHDIAVAPLTGPSSLLLALMASGLNGQCFAFHGYLPVDEVEISVVLRNLERESREKNQTQLFIETPYRNNKLVGHLLKHLRPDTRLCIASHLTASNQSIQCRTIREWKQHIPVLEKVPATFLFLADGK